MSDEDVIRDFTSLDGETHLYEFSDGWYAYFGNKGPLGPFGSESGAAEAGLEEWRCLAPLSCTTLQRFL